MSVLDNAAVCRFHNARIQEFGVSSVESLGWRTEKSQFIRFKALAEIGDMTDCSVMDIGCGHGDLKPYLDSLYAGVRYFGIDQMSAFLDIAVGQSIESFSSATFFHGDVATAVLPNTDYVLASGALNYPNSEPDFIFQIINKLFSDCRIGFAFNLLSKVEAHNDFLTAYNPQLILTYCQTLSIKVRLRQDYLADDFTIYMYKI
jgi:SAM-dependent methyltransferase